MATKRRIVGGARTKKRALTKGQKSLMRKHSSRHTPKHMKLMASLMRKGDSFVKAHKLAQKLVGN